MNGHCFKPLSFEVVYCAAKANWYISPYLFHPCHTRFLTITWIQVNFVPLTLCTCYSQYLRALLTQISTNITLFRSIIQCKLDNTTSWGVKNFLRCYNDLWHLKFQPYPTESFSLVNNFMKIVWLAKIYQKMFFSRMMMKKKKWETLLLRITMFPNIRQLS